MATIDKLLTGRSPVTLDAQSTVFEAVELMSACSIGCVIVTSAEKPCGIFTERDLMIRVVAARLDPQTTRLAAVMTREMLTAPPNRLTSEVRAQMQARHVRHLPIIGEGGVLLGVLSLRDLLRADLEQRQKELRHLTDYIQGEPLA